jgi:oligopeptide transport system permease protein
MWGARVSLTVGIVATLVSLLIGVSYGATAGYFGGWIDAVMMRIVDTLYSVPFIFVVIFIMTFLGEDSVKKKLELIGINQLTVFYLIIGAIYWLTMSRVVRGQVLSLKNEQFVEAARTIGASPARIVFRHLVPNVLGVVIVYLTLTIPAVMLFEAFLSFLGLGVSPPDVSWGLLLKDGVDALSSVKLFWWMVVFPGAALALTLFALNFLGDGLRDALDPKMKNKD